MPGATASPDNVHTLARPGSGFLVSLNDRQIPEADRNAGVWRANLDEHFRRKRRNSDRRSAATIHDMPSGKVRLNIQGDPLMLHAKRQSHAANEADDAQTQATPRLSKLPRLFALALLAACLMQAACNDPAPSGPSPQADTSSHNFVWYIDTLGGILSTVNDVYCVSENDAWAVGYFYYRDPETGKTDWNRNANAAHWDGEKWTMHRINPTIAVRNYLPYMSFVEMTYGECVSIGTGFAGYRTM
jgi:hypothetical protein